MAGCWWSHRVPSQKFIRLTYFAVLIWVRIRLQLFHNYIWRLFFQERPPNFGLFSRLWKDTLVLDPWFKIFHFLCCVFLAVTVSKKKITHDFHTLFQANKHCLNLKIKPCWLKKWKVSGILNEARPWNPLKCDKWQETSKQCSVAS